MDELARLLEVPDDETSRAYLAHLTTLPLFQVADQRRVLAAEEQEADNALKALVVRERSTFTASKASNVLDDLPGVAETLTTLQEQIPRLDAATTFDKDRLAALSRSRKRAAILSRNERRLQDLLDIPDLVRTCVLNGYYSEATTLAQHLDRIRARHPHSATIARLTKEVTFHLERMTLQLSNLLNTPLKLAMAIKVVGLLNRTNAFTEDELRYLFLKGRYDALQEVLEGLECLRDAPERYLKKYVEIFREQVFAVITQYESIFDRPLPPPSPAATRSTLDSTTGILDNATSDNDQADVAGGFRHNLLPHFSQRVVADLLRVLEEFVPLLENGAASRATSFTQTLYAAQSLARAGCDFTPALVELFARADLRDVQDGKTIAKGQSWQEAFDSQRIMARRLD